MVSLTLIDGRKGIEDILILVKADNEPLSFAQWIFIGMCYLKSEASYYPISEGFIGPCMLLEALIEISHGVDFNQVCARRKLDIENLNIIDNRKRVKRGVGENQGKLQFKC